MSARTRLVAVAALVALTAVSAAAQKPHESPAQLKAQAKVTLVSARATALAQVPNGKIESWELEREHGTLLYSFDIATKGKSGIDEVQVDAVSGALVGAVVHESPKAERAEKKAEKAEQKAEAKEKHGKKG